MIKKIISVIAVVFSLAVFVNSNTSSVDAVGYMPDWVMACKGVEPQVEIRTPVAGEVWYPQGEWRVINFWTNEPGHDQTEKKLILSPRVNVGLKGGGTSWSWPKNCASAAYKSYRLNELPRTTVFRLYKEGLVVKPEPKWATECKAQLQVFSKNPVNGEYWNPGDKGNWRVISFWTTEPGMEQTEKKLILSPGRQIEFLGGGTSWVYPKQCSRMAKQTYKDLEMERVSAIKLIRQKLAIRSN